MSLKQKAISGVKWTATSTVITTGLHFIQLIILARLLGPSAIGLMGMIMVVIGFSQAFSDMGISNAIIHRQDATKKQLSSLYWLNLFAGIIVFIILILITPLVVSFYQEPKLTELMHWAALVFIIIPFGQQFQVLLQKELRFNTLAKIEVTSSVSGTMTTIVFALLGFGVISIVWGQVVNSFIKMLNLVILGWGSWRPQLHFKMSDLEGYLSFGLYQMGERTINYFNSNLDYIVIGRFLGPEALGYYTLAYNIIILPVSKINPIITKVAFPVFSKIQTQDEKLKKGYLKVLNILSYINFPIFFGLSVTAYLFVPIIFGNEWMQSILLIQILAFVGLLRSTGNPVGSLLLSKGRADLGFKWNLFLMVTQIPGILIGLWLGGVIGVAVAFLILQIIFSIFNYIILIRRLLKPCLRDYILSMWKPLWMSMVMAISVSAISFIFTFENNILLLTIQVIIGILVYMLLSFIFINDVPIYLKNKLNLKS